MEFWGQIVINLFLERFLDFETFQESILEAGFIPFIISRMSLRRKSFSSRVENVDRNSEMSVLDLPELALDCILERLPPEGLCNMASVCSFLKEKCKSDYLWERHMKEKWGRVIGPAAYREWQWRIASRNDSSFFNQAKQRGFMTYLSQFWPISLVSRSNSSISSIKKKHTPPPVDSVMSWYLALESGKFWFPAQVYNREVSSNFFLQIFSLNRFLLWNVTVNKIIFSVSNLQNGHVGFMLSCYDAELSYDLRTDTFQAR